MPRGPVTHAGQRAAGFTPAGKRLRRGCPLPVVGWLCAALLLSSASNLPAQPPRAGTPRVPEPLFSEGAGEAPFIETDRDSFTPSTTLAGGGRLIIESAYSFLDNRQAAETHSFPELVFRYGLSDRIEARVYWNYEVGGGGSDISGAEGEADFEDISIVRETQISYGAKVRVTDQQGWVPESAFILVGATPTSGKETATAVVATYVWGWTLPGDWKADAALRYSADSEEGDGFSVWAPSFVVKAPLGERWNVHAEYFGLFSQHRFENFTIHYFSPGIHYLVTRDLEIGVRVGWGLNDQAARFFVNAGAGWRF